MDAHHIFRSVVFPTAALLILFPLSIARAESPDLATLQKTLTERFPDQKIIDIRPARVPGLYEVYTGPSIFYSDGTGNYVLFGSMVDTRTKVDLRETRVNERNAIRFDSLPLDNAIKVVKGDGARKLAVFTDPDCPYCKRLEEEMASVSNVTIYLFMFPLKQIHPNAERHAKAIWCSENRAIAWTAWVLDKKEPSNRTCSTDPLDANLQLGEKLNVNGTPMIYFEDGSREAGAMSAADLETRMNKVRKS